MSDDNVQAVVVTIDDRHLPVIDAVAEALRAKGLHVTGVLTTAGIVSGRVAQVRVDALRAVPGVADVELDQEMHALDADVN